MLAMLIESGGDIYCRNYQGLTPRQTIDATRQAWARIEEVQSSIRSFGFQMPGLAKQLPDRHALEKGWQACSQLLQ
jgi:hypothetical protein